MKNTHIKNLHQIVPENIRLEVYKEVLVIIETEPIYVYNHGLCLLLPISLWGLTSYLEEGPNGNKWFFLDTSYAFPELTKNAIKEIVGSGDNANEVRREYLESWIKNLESK